MRPLRSKVGDKRLRALTGAYLRAPLQEANGRKVKRWRGTQQGVPLSPLPANIGLDPLDKELEKLRGSFVRYADDSFPRKPRLPRGCPVKEKGFQGRMRKTAFTVVWKSHRAQSP